MYGYLRQSTAATVLAGPFLAPADGITPKTALTAPAGAASAATSGVALVTAGTAASYTLSGWAHDRLGYYIVNMSTGDTGTAGRLRLEFVDPTNYCPVHMDFIVLPEAVYDGLFGVTAGLPAIVETYTSGQDPATLLFAAALPGTPTAGTAGEALKFADTRLDAAVSTRSTYAGGAVASVTGPVGSVTGNVGGTVASVVGSVGSVVGNVGGNVVGAVASVTAGVTVATNGDKTGYTLASLPAVPTDWLTAAGVKADAVTKIQAGLSTYAGGAVASVTAPVTVGTNSDKTGYSLSVTPPTAAQNATAVWQDTTAGDFTTVNSIGKSLFNAFTAGTSVLTTASLVNAPTGGSAPTAAAIATYLLQDLLSSTDFQTANSVGLALANMLAALDPTTHKPVLAPSGLDLVVVETGINARQALSPILAAAAGVVSGAGSGTVTLKNPSGATTRIVATTDSIGDRTSVTLTLPT